MTADRKNSNKIKLHLMPPEWELELAKVFTQGAAKYSDNNWLRGMPYSWCISSAKRHLNKFLLGESHDEETSCHHLAHAAWNLLAIMSYDIRELGTSDLDHFVLEEKIKELFEVKELKKPQ